MKECSKCKSCYEDILTQCPIDSNTLEESIPGSTILAGKYRIEARLGKGGMGMVYKAMHLGLKRYVALKTLLPQNISHKEFANRFRREAEASGRIKHPNVVDVMDFGFVEVEHREVGYLVMEFLEGYNLSTLIKTKGTISLELTVDIMNQVCQAVDAAHKLGVVHRDLKPHNIWLEEQTTGFLVKVLDFGLAKLIERQSNSDSNNDQQVIEKNTEKNTDIKSSYLSKINQNNKQSSQIEEISILTNDKSINELTASQNILSNKNKSITAVESAIKTENFSAFKTNPFEESIDNLTKTGNLIGTLPYMSPEQCLSKPATAASDIYSLGIIAYEMLSGKRPFSSKSFELVMQHLKDAPPSLLELVPNLPKSVEEAVFRALAKEPSERPSSAREFALALGSHLTEEKRKKASIRKILSVSFIISLALAISAIVSNWAIIEDNWDNLKTSYRGEVKEKSYLSYSKLKLVSLSSSKEFELATSNAIKASKITSEQFVAHFSTDGNLVAFLQPPKSTKNNSQKIEIWSVDEHKKLNEFSIDNFYPIYDLQFSENSKLIAVSGLNEIYIINTLTGTHINKLTTLENNNYVRFISDDTLLVASVRRPQIRVGISVTYPLEKRNSLISLWRISDGQKISDIFNQYGDIESLNIATTKSATNIVLQLLVSEKEPKGRIDQWEITKTAVLKHQWQVQNKGAVAIMTGGNKVALGLSPSYIIEIDPISGEKIKDYNIADLSKTGILHYDKNGHLLTATTACLWDLNEESCVYSPLPNTSILDFAPATRSLLVETVVSSLE
ncbi:MAG: serine/threonine protein kinase [Acidobacteria bacterium]|nr:serine/threonine protein kinase [Acidobacteriota bacterium]